MFFSKKLVFSLCVLSATFLNANSSLNISGASITNTGQMGENLSTVTMTSGSLTNSGTFGFQVGTISISGGYINNSGVIGENSTIFDITGGSFTLTGNSNIGSGTYTSLSINNVAITNPVAGVIAKKALSFTLGTAGALTNSGLVGYSAGFITIYGSVTNNTGGDIAKESGTFTLGTAGELTNSGIVAFYPTDVIINGSVTNNTGGDIGSYATGFTIGTAGKLINSSSGYVACGGEYPSGTVDIYGSVTNEGYFGENATNINLFNGIFSNGTTGVLGTTSLALQGGQLVNNGTVIASPGHFMAGTFTGTGNLILCDYSTGTISITQGTIYVGYSGEAGEFTVHNDLTSYVNVGEQGVLTGTSTITRLLVSGDLKPGFGSDFDSLGLITVSGSATFNGTLGIDINGTATDLLTTNGELNLGLISVLNLSAIALENQNYTISNYGNRSGTFSVVIYPTGFGSTHNLVYNPTSLVLEVSGVAPGGSITWTGLTSNDWQTAGNWSGEAVPLLPNDIYFNTWGEGAPDGSITLNGEVGYADSMTFVAGGENFTFISGTIQLQGLTSPVINGTGSQEFQCDISLKQSSTLYSSGLLTFNNLYGSASPVSRQSLTLTGLGEYTIKGNFGYSFGVIDVNTNVINSSGSIGKFAGTVNLSNASITNQGQIGENASNVYINGGTYTASVNTVAPTIGCGSVDYPSGTVQITNINIVNPPTAGIANNATKLITTSNVELTNSGTIGYNTHFLTISGSITNNSTGIFGVNTNGSFSDVTIINNGVFGLTSSINLLSGTLSNFESGQFGSNGTINSSITIINGDSLQSSSFGYNASITINGGSITNLANFANGEGVTLTLSGGDFYNSGTVADGSSAGPIPVPVTPPGFKETAKRSRLNATKPSLLERLPQELSYLPMYGIINQLQNTSDASIKKVIDTFFALPNEQKMQALKELAPAFKLAQYSLEKLDLLIHKELETSLYTKQDGIRPFVMAGYDNLAQSAWDSYQGYNVNSFYQFVGLSGDYKKIKILGALGTSQSFMTLDTNSANASYYTAYAAFGLSSGHKRWHYGIDGLFGYSFFYGNRSIALLNETATTDHNLYNISVDSKLSYDFIAGNNSFSAYEQLGYIYGQEQAYQESGASGANLTVNGENISVIRNALGFTVDTKIKSWETQTAHKKRHDFHQNGTQISFDEETVSMHKDEIRVFLDGSWVYDYYLNTNNFQASFTGTNVYTTVNLGVPIQNYGRVRAGFNGTHKKYNWQLAYTGLFGQNYIENSASLFLGRKF